MTGRPQDDGPRGKGGSGKGGSGKRGSGKGPRSRRAATNPQVRAKAARLEREAGLPRTLAFQVAMGNVSLSEVLERMARRDRVEALMRRHELPKSLATQVALGQADLDQVLVRRRRESHLAEHRTHSLLTDMAESGEAVFLGLLGHRRLEGTVLSVDKYEFDFQPKKGEVETVHKLQVKFGVDLSQGSKARNALRVSKKGEAAEPVWKPQDRYGISDKRLFGYLDDELDIQVDTSEGDIVRGKVSWMGRWEFAVRTKKGPEVVVFRHALANVKVV